jgi:hypothetical protein
MGADAEDALILLCNLQAVGDPFIWVPNGIGGVVSVFLLALSIMYPSTAPSSTASALATPLKPP